MADEEYSEEESTESKADDETSEEEFLATARRRFEDCSSDEKPIREQALLDLKFVIGDQWESSIKTERTSKGRPALTFNRCHTFVQQVANEARQMRGEIKYAPKKDDDKDTAEVFEGLARHIQYNSKAKIAYETAIDYSAGGSFGYYRFLPQYCDDKGWDQDIKVVPVFDPFAIYGVLIPSCFGLQPPFAFVIEEIPTEDYKLLYPKSQAAAYSDYDQAAKLSQGWIGTNTVRVAEYWYVEHDTKTIKRKNPQTGEEESRVVDDPKVCFCKINGMEVLEGTKTRWLGKRIPIFPVLGKQVIVDGKPNLFSIVRFQRDPQQLINFYKTRIAETLGTAPIQPFIVTEGQVKGYEREWNELNTTMRPYLTVKSVDLAGKPIPPPQRQVFEPPIASLTNAAAQEIDDMKATTGMYDASLGSRSNETSGTAIARRQQQSNVTNMHFIDNLERSFDESGIELARVIPLYYDAPRMVRILGRDETAKIVHINKEYDDGGKIKHHKISDIEVGEYDIVVSMGRSFSTKRMETFDMMNQLIQSNPDVFPLVADILFRNSDMAGAEILAERFKKGLPPNLQDNPNDPQTQVQILQQKLQQAQQQLQAIDAYAAQLQKEKETKVVEHQTKVQVAQMQELSRQEIVRMQEATKLAVAQINASKDANQSFAENEIEQYKILHESAHELAMQSQQHAHEQELADKQAAQATMDSGQSANG